MREYFIGFWEMLSGVVCALKNDVPRTRYVSGVRISHGDDDFSLRVSLLQIADGLGDLA
jgi:hypothetical protein